MSRCKKTTGKNAGAFYLDGDAFANLI